MVHLGKHEFNFNMYSNALPNCYTKILFTSLLLSVLLNDAQGAKRKSVPEVFPFLIQAPSKFLTRLQFMRISAVGFESICCSYYTRCGSGSMRKGSALCTYKLGRRLKAPYFPE